MRLREDRPSWLTRAAVIVLLLGGGLLGAIPFRRSSPPPPQIARHTSDSVKLVFRNQDITLTMNPRREESPAVLPPTASLDLPHEALRSPAKLPAMASQYQSLLDPKSTTPPNSPPPIPGRVFEPAAPAPLREHVLVDGDSLPRLSERYLGNASRAFEIQNLNPEVLRNPETLPIGKVILIPRK